MPVTCVPNSTQSLRFLQFYHHPYNALSFLMPAPAIQTQAESETDGRFGGVSWIVSCKMIYWSLNRYLQMRSSSEIESLQMWLRCVLRVGDTGVGWPYKKRRRNVETDTHRETKATWWQRSDPLTSQRTPKDCQPPTGARKGQGWIPPRVSRESMVMFRDFWSPELSKNTFLVFEATQILVSCYSSPRKLNALGAAMLTDAWASTQTTHIF